jgi:DNA modification methylase
MAKKSPTNQSEKLFEEKLVPAKAGSGELFETSYGDDDSPVECLGMTFENDSARREHFLDLLREKLKDPEFRKIEGFPVGDDDRILNMSDPPYYTACPNPFLGDFIEHIKSDRQEDTNYHREPFAVDVNVGKTDALYKAHGYHTKVPHLAIVPSILHYTRPGDVILDGFCGSGLMGVAAKWCSVAPKQYRSTLASEFEKQESAAPDWGNRYAILSDLSPAASFIATNYTLPFSLDAFVSAGHQLLSELKDAVGWMYETEHTNGQSAQINFTVWSEVFTCPECASDIVFYDEAFDKQTKRVKKIICCPSCSASLKKTELTQKLETVVDAASRQPWSRLALKPVQINYDFGGETFEKQPSKKDMSLLSKIAGMSIPSEVPTGEFPFDDMWEAPRLKVKGFKAIHQMFLPRPVQALGEVWQRVQAIPDRRLRNMLVFFVEQAITGMSVLNRYGPTHYSQVNRYLSGAYYVGSQISEVPPWYILEGKLRRLANAFASISTSSSSVCVSTSSCTSLPIPDGAIDYVFTDPPFGDNFPYAELNYLVESWHGLFSELSMDAIVDRGKKNKEAQKTLSDYQSVMSRCFAEYFRVLKPGRWMTVVFSNSKNVVWHAIQEALGDAGFVVADVRTLDKQQRSFRQVTSAAVKQDLVISAYKPTSTLLESFELGASTEANAWAFISEHLSNVPVFVEIGGKTQIVVERTAQMLFDRMVGFHVQRGLAVPISSSEFLVGLAERFPPRDDMYFLHEQIPEYDRRRLKAQEVAQLSLFVTDEASAIQWVRQELRAKPSRFEDLQPTFMRELTAWADYEEEIELSDILKQNFLCYCGDGEVPSQIHGYLSTNFKDCRNLSKDDPALIARALERWYVPDPRREADLERVRHLALMKEFEEHRTSKGKLKLVRTESLRAGFKECWQRQDYKTIVVVAERVKESIIQEDTALLMYYDNASMLVGD